MKTLEQMILRSRHTITVPSGNEENTVLAATCMKNLSDLGFTIDQAGYELLKTASKEDITSWYYDVVKELKNMVGANHQYRPLYPNFPEEVMDMTEVDYFIDQLIYWWTGYEQVPEGVNEKEFIKSLEEHPLKVMTTIDAKEPSVVLNMASDIFKNTLRSKMNLSETDLNKIVKPFIKNVPDWNKYVSEVENRANLCYLYAQAVLEKKNTSSFPSLVTNDYMRIAKLIAHKDKMDEMTDVNELKVGNVPNSVRKFIANGIESQKNLEEDVARNPVEWKVLFKTIHIGEYKNCKKANAVANKLRNNQRLNTFYGRVEQAFQKKDVKEVVRLYKSRPGEFVKNMDRLLRIEMTAIEATTAIETIISAWKETAPKVRTEDLINLVEHLKSRTRESDIRVHNVAGTFYQSGKILSPLSEKIVQNIIETTKDTISQQLYNGKNMGKVYIDPAMYGMVLPRDIKQSSDAMGTYTKGSRLEIEKTEQGKPKNIRAFIWWTNTEKSTIDIDLSAVFYKNTADNKFQLQDKNKLHYNSPGMKYGCTYSGDRRSGGPIDGPGVAEFIDLDMNCLKKNEIDYVALYVNSFSGENWYELNCEAGWMEREELDKSAQFDARAVQQKTKLTGRSAGEYLCMVDVNAEQIIWLDSPDFRAKQASNVTTIKSGIDMLMERYGYQDRLTMGEIVELSMIANSGERVNTPEEADIIFVKDCFEGKKENQRVITSKDQDIWLGEFMTPQSCEDEAEIGAKERTEYEMNASIENMVFDNIFEDIPLIYDAEQGKVQEKEDVSEIPFDEYER